MLMTFVTVMAWIVGVVATILSGICAIAGWSYEGSTQQLRDNYLRGIDQNYFSGMWTYAFFAIVAWVWLGVYYFGG